MTFPGPVYGDSPFSRQDFPIDYDPAAVQTGDVPILVQDDRLATITLLEATGGSFVLQYGISGDFQATSSLPFNITPAGLQAALETLTKIGAGNVLVTGSAGGPWSARIVRAQRGALQIASTSLTPVGATAYVEADMVRDRRMELRHRRSWPSVDGLVTPLVAPTLVVGAGFAPGALVLGAVRAIAPRTGLLTDLWVPIVAGAGNGAAAIYAPASPRALVWAGPSVALRKRQLSS